MSNRMYGHRQMPKHQTKEVPMDADDLPGQRPEPDNDADDMTMPATRRVISDQKPIGKPTMMPVGKGGKKGRY